VAIIRFSLMPKPAAWTCDGWEIEKSRLSYGGGIGKEALALFSIWAGRRINSLALIGDGWHHRSDALASLVIVLGAVFGGGLWWLDGALGLGVSVLLHFP